MRIRAALLPLLAAALPAQIAEAPAATTIDWLADLGAARERAGKRGAPLCVVFRCER
ncbi:MAG: hypothetical protein KDE27_00190 [Planctomycetes bacterium]|nr:hypothetical protein [Planctomycetota bacterium]